MLGLTLILASITPFIPDVQDVVSLIAKAGLFLVPVLYTPAMFSEQIWRLFYLNPFSYMIWIHHDALFYQSITMPTVWVVAAALSLATLFLGSHLFRVTSPSFAEAI
jgi:ABC-type polysaccharide/polyol phosphate export permease